jgi:hypothetical protein
MVSVTVLGEDLILDDRRGLFQPIYIGERRETRASAMDRTHAEAQRGRGGRRSRGAEAVAKSRQHVDIRTWTTHVARRRRAMDGGGGLYH